MRGLTSLGGGFFLVAVFSLIGLNADNVVIAAQAGAVTVAEYGVPARLGTILMLIVSTLFMPLWALFGDALARNDQKWLNQISLRMSVLGGASVLVIGLALTWYVDLILTLWMGRPFADQELIMLGWTAAATIIAITAPYNMVLNAAGMAAPQVLPWAVFLGVSVMAKALFLTEETAWSAPWITAGVYLVAITPAMIFTARRRISETNGF
jgi:O-antigen/teichoic acid export membrane protein